MIKNISQNDNLENLNTNLNSISSNLNAISTDYTPWSFSIYGAVLNGYCSNALLISSNQFHDANKPMLVHYSKTTNLPSDCENGTRFVFVYDANNIEVVIIGRGSGSATLPQNVWINHYIKDVGWAGWVSLR